MMSLPTRLVSQLNPKDALSNIQSVKLTASADIVLQALWEQARDSYLDGRYLAAVIVAGTCTEAALRFFCRDKGISSKKVKMKWAELIQYSTKKRILVFAVGRAMSIVRLNYRNPWTHIDLQKITNHSEALGLASSTSALVVSQQQALDCLWLAAVSISRLYGSQPSLFDWALLNLQACLV
jgi:hypothetical protein